MEYKGTNAAQPSWRMPDQFVSSDVIRALVSDSSAFTHAIAANVTDPDEIQEIFDDISYGKGATILRMLEMWLNQAAGPSHFFNSLHKYLNSHRYSNAKTLDLWNALDNGKLNIAPFMSSWTDQPGFPVLIVENVGKGKYSLRQERFFAGGLLTHKDWALLLEDSNLEYDEIVNNSQSWILHVSMTEVNSNGVHGSTSVTVKDKVPVHIESSAADALPLLNLNHAGAFHVMYPADLLSRLSQALYHQVSIVSPADRAGLLMFVFVNRVTEIVIQLQFVGLVDWNLFLLC